MIDPNDPFFKQCGHFMTQIQNDMNRIGEFLSNNQLSALRHLLKKYNSLLRMESVSKEQFEKDGKNDILIDTLNKILDYKMLLEIINKHLTSDDDDDKILLLIKEDFENLIH
jgi:hypothetical protein